VSIPRVHVWKAGEVVTDDDLNAEFNNILLNPLYGDSTGAASIGFTQSGTGATARTAQSKLRDIVSILDYGGVADGVTDNATAISNALAASNKGVSSRRRLWRMRLPLPFRLVGTRRFMATAA
jgi:polygalacturonase